MNGNAVLVGTWQRLLHGSFLAGKGHGVALSALRREDERTATALLYIRFCNDIARALGHRHLSFKVQALVACRFESDAVGDASHKVAAFREELQLRLGRGLVYFRLATQGTKRHLVEEVAWLLGLVENGKDAAIELVVIEIVLPRHAFIEEPLLGNLVVGMFRDTPIELPSRVGSQLVIAAIKRVLQDKTAVHLAVLKFELLTFHEIAVLIQQFCIENTAQTAWRTGIATTDICLIVNGIAQEIARIVHVHKDLFLRNRLAESLQAVGPTFERGGYGCLLCSQKGYGASRNKQQEKEKTFHVILFFRYDVAKLQIILGSSFFFPNYFISLHTN